MRKIISCGVGLVMIAMLSSNSYGTTVTFGDSNRYWGDNSTTWTSAEKWASDDPNGIWDGNKIDVIGDPDITGGTATFNDAGRLTEIVFNYFSPLKDWRMLAPGNLFINVLSGANDVVWDYVVYTMGNAKLNPDKADGSKTTLAPGYYSIYDISSKNISAKRGINDSSYILSGKDNSGDWAGYYLRNNHPIGMKCSVLEQLSIGSAYYTGFPGNMTDGDADKWTGKSSYSFTGLLGGGLNLYGRDIIIGWEMTCANDVLYEKVNNPVPEPATMLLFGTGLAGLAGGIRLRKAKKA